MSDHVRIERAEAVLSITLARPERRNAITVAMYEALAGAIEQASADASVRVITLAGEGADFAAGNDLADFLDTAPRGDDIPVWRLLRALVRCQTPLVAAVHGNCVGIGTTMLLHCDLVVAAEGTRFSLPFIDLALVPEAASSLLLPRLAGRRRAARYLLLGEPFGVDEAMAIGLISHRAEPSALATKRDALVAALLAKPQDALRETQRLLRHGEADEILQRMELEGAAFSKRLEADEVKHAITAFFAKRKPAS
ncbi:MAG: enoyl-CoA hydratase-related protein [Sphingomicrobium sp.]